MNRYKEFFIAFFASLLLWSLATSQNLSRTSFFVTLVIANMPDGFTISKKFDNKLNIEVSGPKSIISKLATYDFSAVYRMPEIVNLGEFSFRLNPSDISSPSGVEVKSVSPSFIRIYIDKTITKTLDITPDITGVPAVGYEVTGYELFPPKVTLKGPMEILDKLQKIKTESPFDVTGLDGPFKQKIRLVASDSNITFVDTQFTTIEVKINPILITKRLENIPVTTYPLEIKTKLIPETFRADFKGPKNLIDKIIQPGITAVIDIRDYTAGLNYLLQPVFPDLPSEILVVDRNPKKITVRILKENEKGGLN
jgi:YbbR domain-containing protein